MMNFKIINETESKQNYVRAGCKDVWNAFMVEKAEFSPITDMPVCYSAKTIPKRMISFADAKTLYNKKTKSGESNFFVDAFIHFYIDDLKFDGKYNSVWDFPEKALEIISHFAGIITPDFSTYTDFPDPIKRMNTYRMRAFGCWINSKNIPVINNVRWGTVETWSYCFDGIPQNSIVAVGTVASELSNLCNRPLFEYGLYKMVSIIKPTHIIVYGSANYSFFKKLSQEGIDIIAFPSRKAKFFSKEEKNEQE